jgi:hypothetical protein
LNDAIWHHALSHEPPQGDQKLARQGHDHGLASTAGVLGAGSKPLTANSDFLRGFVWQLAKLASPVGDFDENRLNFIASIITDNQPRDQNEAMLTAQMAAVHLAMMSFAGYMATADNLNLPKLDSYQRALNARSDVCNPARGVEALSNRRRAEASGHTAGNAESDAAGCGPAG